MIGFYVHHHGAGHRTRAVEIARRLGGPVVGFGSMPAPGGWPGEWCELPSDLDPAPVDPTAGGVLHWAPLRHDGHRRRLGAIARALADGLDALVVDTSAEVALLGRLFGTPVVLGAMPGDRSDRPHRAAYDAATAIVAPWPRPATSADWPAAWIAKATFTGGISRFDDRLRSDDLERGRDVLVLTGGGGSTLDAARVDHWRAATPDRRWIVRSPERPSPDLWRDLAEVAVVVAHAGQNVVAELAAARAPAVVVAEPRPHGEQAATVAALRALDCCEALDRWPDADACVAAIGRAERRGGDGWVRWSTGGGAHDAAEAIRGVASGARR